MSRMTIQTPVPQHCRAHSRRVIGRLSDLQRMAAHELLRDPATQNRDHVRLYEDRKSVV